MGGGVRDLLCFKVTFVACTHSPFYCQQSPFISEAVSFQDQSQEKAKQTRTTVFKNSVFRYEKTVSRQNTDRFTTTKVQPLKG